MTVDPHTILSGPQWHASLGTLAKQDVSRTLEATAEQRIALADALSVTRVDALRAQVSVTALDRGRVRVTGQVDATFEQACVVSDAPVPTVISEPINLILVPPETLSADGDAEAIELGALTDDEPLVEALSGDHVGLGRIVYETFAVAVPAFPRADGADLPENVLASNRAAQQISPFAALAELSARDPDKDSD